MKRTFILAIMAVLLSACIASGGNTGSEPVLIASPAISPGASSTMTPTALPTLLPPPSPTPVPAALILADFPLAVGATWKYSAEISYQDPKGYDKLVTWSGSITDKVIDRKTTPDGKIVFTLQEDLKPTPTQDVWRQSGTLEYTVSGNGISDRGIKIYQWPLGDKLAWQAFSSPGYDTVANYIGAVKTPYGELKGCYKFVLQTLPDTTIDNFCPGVGFVEHYYMHHGTPQNEHFVLVTYMPGQ